MDIVDGLINSLQKALDKQDGFSISVIVTRLENLGYKVDVNNDTRQVRITKERDNAKIN